MSNKQIESLQAAANNARKEGDEQQASFIESQIRKIKRNLINQKKKAEREAYINNVEANTDNLEWKMRDKNGEKVDGMFEGICLFKIERGMVLYKLDILSENITKHNGGKSRYTSTNFFTLKKKADKILSEFLISNKK